MSDYSRRDFIKDSGRILGAGTLGSSIFGCRPLDRARDKKKEMPASSEWGGFNYAMCNESMGELSWAEQCQIVGDAGYKGIEIAAFTLVKEGVQEISSAERKEMVSVMKNNGLECAGLHWLLAPPPKGLHFNTPDAAIRQKTIAYFDELIDYTFYIDVVG